MLLLKELHSEWLTQEKNKQVTIYLIDSILASNSWEEVQYLNLRFKASSHA